MIRPILTNPRALARDSMFMVGVTCLLGALIWYDLFTRPVGMALVALLLVYMIGSIVLDSRGETEAASLHADEGESMDAQHSLPVGLVLALAGIAAVVFGARFLVDGGMDLAQQWGFSETVIGLSIVAIGTSLPELATSAVAAFRGKSDVALGNILGSNIFNILGILGITAIVHPFTIQGEAGKTGDIIGEAMTVPGAASSLVSWEHMGALILSVFLLLLFAFTGKRLARWEGALMLFAYALYLGLLFNVVPTVSLLPNGG